MKYGNQTFVSIGKESDLTDCYGYFFQEKNRFIYVNGSSSSFDQQPYNVRIVLFR